MILFHRDNISSGDVYSREGTDADEMIITYTYLPMYKSEYVISYFEI